MKKLDMKEVITLFALLVSGLLCAPLPTSAQTPIVINVQSEGKAVPVIITICTEADTVKITDVFTPVSHEVATATFSAIVNQKADEKVSVQIVNGTRTTSRTSSDPMVVKVEGSSVSVSAYRKKGVDTQG